MNILRIFLFVFLTTSVFADDETDIIVLPQDVVHQGDYFASGKNVEISGVVDGDVYVFGSQVFIDGYVKGDVLVAGGNVHISGHVGQNVRLVGGQVIFSGNVGRNVTVIAGNAEFSSSSVVQGNVIAITGNLDLDGKFDRNVRVFTSNIRVSDLVRGNLTVYAAQMRVTSKAILEKNLEYWSNSAALIDPSAQIKGEIIHHPSFFYTLTKGKFLKGLKFGSKFVAILMNFLYSFVIGLLLIYFFSPKLERSLGVLTTKPLEAFIYGILVLILLPLIALMLLMTIVGVPFGLTVLASIVVSFYTAKIISILWVVKKISGKIGYERHKKLYFSLGLILYFIVVSIPYLGFVVSMIAMLFGLGSVALGSLEKTKALSNPSK